MRLPPAKAFTKASHVADDRRIATLVFLWVSPTFGVAACGVPPCHAPLLRLVCRWVIKWDLAYRPLEFCRPGATVKPNDLRQPRSKGLSQFAHYGSSDQRGVRDRGTNGMANTAVSGPEDVGA